MLPFILNPFRCVSLALLLIACSLLHAHAAQPNILIILSDDQGYGDFGFTGNSVVQTPALDALSTESAFYPHFIVGPACTPTRVSLYTGRHHLDTGVWGVGSRGKVRRDEVMMPRFFTPAGYQTWVIGKLDGGLTMMELGPLDRGFDWFCSATGGSYIQRNPTIVAPGLREPREGWTAELLTDKAIEKIRTEGDQPWMLHMNYIIPHLFWECPDAYADIFRNQGYSESLAQCYGSIKQMDDQIGRLLEALDELGQTENTIVIFMSDNGSLDAVGNREVGVWENSAKKRAHSDDWQYRNPDGLIGRKGEVWDNGIRSPLLVRWPAKIKSGIRQHVVGVEDILPTVLQLAQIPEDQWPAHLPFAGTSFANSLANASAVDERDIFRLATGGPGTPYAGGDVVKVSGIDYGSLHTILRSGKYKFHHLPGGVSRLYDMAVDPTETNDLSQQMPERTAAMATRCQAQWDAIAERDRSFPMRQLRINNADRPRQTWRIQVLQPLGLSGEMYAPDFGGGIKGFRNPGDRADYAIEVQQPLTVSVVVEGKGLDQCAPISLLIDGKPIAVKSRAANQLVFAAAALSAGSHSLSLAVAHTAESGGGKGEVTKILLTKEK